ncbi:pyrrolo-quinoline quinone [Haloferax elongans ATCC BAA-1513]|uniref:Pyrrolo-quinoline quinone n=1 Tax=Haloferax elongans ATCC BAA-1513 TaxID=1230453 RepID=M0I2H4_HALEO|nr:pyrrolo-quinoline quinone [Haloferax elongans ATCC BAA-1513]
MDRYDPEGTGYNPAASGPKDGVKVAWSHDSTGWFRGTESPILLDDTLYAVGEGLLALDAETGAKKFGHPGPYQSPPARSQSSVYNTDTLAVGSSAGVFGLNASGGFGLPLTETQFGVERWNQRYETGRFFFSPADPVAPVVADGAIYTPIPGENDIAALDPDDGKIRWRTTILEDDTASADFNRPAVKDGFAYVTNWPNGVTALHTDSGEKHWQRDVDEQLLLPPIATEAGLVVPSRGVVWLLDPNDGTTLWKRTLDANATESASAVADGTIFVTDERESLHALDLETGETLWTAPFGGATAPVVADGVVYAVKEGYSLVAFDAETGDKRFEFQPPQVPLSAPVVGDGVLYAVNRERVIALEEAK